MLESVSPVHVVIENRVLWIANTMVPNTFMQEFLEIGSLERSFVYVLHMVSEFPTCRVQRILNLLVRANNARIVYLIQSKSEKINILGCKP